MKWLKIFAWIVFPYIMIFFAWKKFGVIKRTVGVLWALFILSATIAGQGGETTDTIAKTDAPKTTVEQSETQTAKALVTAAPVTETKKPVAVATEADVTAADQTTKQAEEDDDGPPVTNARYDVILEFPAARYPKTAAHIAAAIEAGQPAVCTIDRNGADANRDASLVGLATKAGHDRDEWPMAMCDEGGAGADVAYVPSSENRGSGSWVGNKLREYDDGTRVLFVLDGESTEKVVSATEEPPAVAEPAQETVKTEKPAAKTQAPTKAPAVEEPAPAKQPDPVPIVEAEPEPQPIIEEPEVEYVFYENCSAVRAAGADPIYEGEPGYSRKLDRDGDGVGCEK